MRIRLPNPTVVAIVLLVSFWGSTKASGAEVLVEAESFQSRGGWKLDTQFIDEMGSPYLLAHGLGAPVEDAQTTVTFPTAGKYNVFVRTKDWVARWQAPGQPGRFELHIDGQRVPTTFGTQGVDWGWQRGGSVEIPQGDVKVALHDVTGFDGRCDAIFFSTDPDSTPPNESQILPTWRRNLLGLAESPIQETGFDFVVIGGGYSGMGAAISAARMGCQVALIQNRAVLGGNGSSEVRVWSQGLIRRGHYPRIGEIIEEFADRASKSPGKKEEFGDELKEKIVRAEKNIKLFLNHHAFELQMADDQIETVSAFDTRSGAIREFHAPLFCDCTGHAAIGHLANADSEFTATGRMGMSNMWRWDESSQTESFPQTPWALDLTMRDFPYPRDHHGQWFWESGFDKDPLNGAEAIRDWNLRAVYGAFNAMKNRDGAEKHANAKLTWVAYVGGPRESRRLLGDVVLSQDDIVDKREFSDGCVPSTWSIDLHYPKKQYAEKFPDNPFISIAVHDRRVDRGFGYPVPYRCFYSRNVPNLFMAGRCVSVSHQALGTVRVMKTCGMMGEVVGKAASICAAQKCSPREVYTEHLAELKKLLNLPGKSHRDTVDSDVVIPSDIPRLASSTGPMSGKDPAKLKGYVIDDRQATKYGKWQAGQGLKGYIGYTYLYSSGDDATITFPFNPPQSANYEVRVAYLSHQNRGKSVPITVETADETRVVQIDMSKPAPDNGFVSLGVFELTKAVSAKVIISSKNSRGTVHADAVQFLPIQ